MKLCQKMWEKESAVRLSKKNLRLALWDGETGFYRREKKYAAGRTNNTTNRLVWEEGKKEGGKAVGEQNLLYVRKLGKEKVKGFEGLRLWASNLLTQSA